MTLQEIYQAQNIKQKELVVSVPELTHLVKHLDLTLSAIEKRKKNLKELFFVEDGKDETLINIAKEKGYI